MNFWWNISLLMITTVLPMSTCVTSHVFVICCITVLTYKFVIYVECNWANCTVVVFWFSCVPDVRRYSVCISPDSWRQCLYQWLGQADILRIYRSYVSNKVTVFLFLLRKGEYPSNSGFKKENWRCGTWFVLSSLCFDWCLVFLYVNDHRLFNLLFNVL